MTASVLDASRVVLDTAQDVADYTRDLVYRAFLAENLASQADRDPTALSMSGLGGCTRACAYSVARTPPTDVAPREDARQAMLGVWIDRHLLPRMAEIAGPEATIQQPVRLTVGNLVISGTLDLALPEVVWDLKTVKEWRLHGVRRRGTYSEHRVQVMGYALARYQAGHPVKWVCFLYMDRSTGDIHVEVERFTNAAALAVIERVEQIKFHAADGPDRAPREARGPGLSFACDRCPWLRRCWGDDAKPGKKGPQRTIAATREGIEYALALYAAGTVAGGQADKDQEFAKLILDGVPPGTYGGWQLKRGKAGSTVDHERIKADYAARGQEVPKKPTTGRMIVTPAPQEE